MKINQLNHVKLFYSYFWSVHSVPLHIDRTAATFAHLSPGLLHFWTEPVSLMDVLLPQAVMCSFSQLIES